MRRRMAGLPALIRRRAAACLHAVSGPARERGAAAVEFALLAPILVTLVLGIIDFSRVYNAQATLSGAARTAARVMALQNDQTAARQTAESAASALNIQDSQISFSPSSCPASGNGTQTIQVTITYPITFLSTFYGTGITVNAQGVMRCTG